jgi:hypothetical protein
MWKVSSMYMELSLSNNAVKYVKKSSELDQEKKKVKIHSLKKSN